MKAASDGTTKKIYRKILSKSVQVKHVCEVGVFLPQMSNVFDFITKSKTKTTLVEPDPKSIKAIQDFFGSYSNVTLCPFAVYDYNGTMELVQREASTFAADLSASPALVNDNYQVKEEDKFSVECKTFDRIDDGTIDLLSIDTEGCEWFVIKNLRSKPLVISLETHGKKYVNPYFNEINKWMNENGYEPWFMDRSDTVYYKKGSFTMSLPERMQLWWMDLYVKFRRFKKNVI
jgi:FkbM family methyltransferase